MNKFLKVTVLGVLMVAVTGCASVNGALQSAADNGYKLSKDGTGVVYGPAVNTSHSMDEVCGVVKDSRCSSKQDYQVVMVIPAVGYMSSGTFLFALAPKDMSFKTGSTGCSSCDYLKVKLEQGKLGTVLERASTAGDGKCKWSGMPRAGGTVCQAYNWDYRKDMRDWNTTNGVMSVME